MGHRHRLGGVGVLKLRQIPAHRSPKVDDPLLRQLHDAQGRKGLGNRRQAKNRIFVNGRLIFRIPEAKKFLIQGHIFVDDRHCQTGSLIMGHHLFDPLFQRADALHGAFVHLKNSFPKAGAFSVHIVSRMRPSVGFFLQNFLDAKKKQMVYTETEKSKWVF